MNGLKFIISLISFNLLVSQAGLNVYMLYCCCKKNIEYSFLPQQDDCFKKTSTKNCCSKSSACSSKGIQKGNCKSHFLEHKSFNSKASIPNSINFSLDIDVPKTVSFPNIIKEIKPVKSILYYNSATFVLSGADIILRKCNWLC